MIDIERQLRKSKSVPLISLIDVCFQLLIYFMLTTSFTRSESLELSLPAAAQANKKIAMSSNREDAKTLHIYISSDGETFLEKKSMNEHDMVEELKSLLAVSPDRGILVLSAAQVPVKVLVRVLDRIYTAGGTNIAVADWIMPPQALKAAPAKPEKPEKADDNG
jgi:biopolymer transport protein ExbD